MSKTDYNAMVLASAKSRAASWGEGIKTEANGYSILDHSGNQIGHAADIIDLAEMYNIKYKDEENDNYKQPNPQIIF